MSLHPTLLPPIPEETARLARAAHPQGNLYLHLRDALGVVFSDAEFADLFPRRGRPAEAPWRLALVTLFQFLEDLSDRQAAEALRSRMDWKYALSLPLSDPGFTAPVLSEFRTRLLAGGAAARLFERLLEEAQMRGWLTQRGRVRTDSTQVLAAVRDLNRLELVGESLVHTLTVLAEVAPTWVQGHVPAEWVGRYGRPVQTWRLPKGQARRATWVAEVGADGTRLLVALAEPETPAWLREVPAVERLRQVWAEQYDPPAQGGGWRAEARLPPAGQRQRSPYDGDARYAVKGQREWVGYKVHLSETCEPGQPHLIIQVVTTPACTSDAGMLPVLHQQMRAAGRLPGQHLVDSGYVVAQQVVQSREQAGVEVIGPCRADQQWQARAQTGYDARQFDLDWQAQQARCPQGATSRSWKAATDHGRQAVVKISFSARDCRPCPARLQCTHAARRTLTVRAEAAALVLRAGQVREQAAAYGARAGIEGTISQSVRVAGLRHARYRGAAKTHLQHLLTAAALNLARMVDWLERPTRPPKRQSALVRVLAA